MPCNKCLSFHTFDLSDAFYRQAQMETKNRTGHQEKEYSRQFIQALESSDIIQLRSVPKTELHSHGNLAFHTYEFSSIIGAAIPAPPKKFHTFEAFMAYIQAYIHPLMDSRAEMEHILFHAIEMAIDDGVVALEMSIDGKFARLWDHNDAFLSYLSYLVSHFREKIDFRPELGLNREDTIENLAFWAMPLIESGIFRSIDLYGNEDQGNLVRLKDIFKAAKANGLKLKAHAGEYGTASQMYETIRVLGLDEVQHGIAAASDPELLAFLRQEQIWLHICPTSNVVLDRVESMEQHPIRQILDAGVPVTINSDDLAVFDQTVSQEYLNLYKAGVLSAEELDGIRVQALDHFASNTR